MTIASFQFLCFACVSALIYNALASVSWRKATLASANVAFLLSFSDRAAALAPLLTFVTYGYVAIKTVQRRHSQATYLGLLAGVLIIFFWLKKYIFLPEISFLQFAYTTLGLSYIFFRVLHMLIDAHQRELGEEVTVLSYFNYTLNFTTLVSGPIQRYPDFIRQHLAAERPPLTVVDMADGAERVVLGFFKVNVVSLVLSMLQNHEINLLSASQPLLTRAVTGAVIAASYPVYLYFNFSGYCDIVIGVARFLRIVLPENFDRPFSTDNFLDFWNHWHKTLSAWLRTYLYNPMLLGLMRRYPSQGTVPFLGVLAFFVTFFLIGVWHGRTSEFLFYGVLLGAGVSINKLYQIEMSKLLGKKRYKELSSNFAYQSVCRGLNFTFFSFYLLWFWSSWQDLGHMSVTLGPRAQGVAWALIFATSTLVLAAWQVLRNAAIGIHWGEQPFFRSRYVRTVWDTGLVFVLVAVMVLLSTPAPDIVYKAF